MLPLQHAWTQGNMLYPPPPPLQGPYGIELLNLIHISHLKQKTFPDTKSLQFMANTLYKAVDIG